MVWVALRIQKWVSYGETHLNKKVPFGVLGEKLLQQKGHLDRIDRRLAQKAARLGPCSTADLVNKEGDGFVKAVGRAQILSPQHQGGLSHNYTIYYLSNIFSLGK